MQSRLIIINKYVINHIFAWHTLLIYNAIGNKRTAKFSYKVNLTQETCSLLLLFETASSSQLEVESANGSKQYDKDETTKCHV